MEEYNFLHINKNIIESVLPTKLKNRTWGVYSICACWIGMNICIPAYQMASSAMAMGIDWGMALFLVLMGNLLILIPIQLNSYVGVKYGISFPIYARLSFGIKGAVFPTLLRTIIGIAWSGILIWNGSESLYVIITTANTKYGTTKWMMVCFCVVWLITIGIAYGGERILKKFESLCAPILIFIFLSLMGFMAWQLVVHNRSVLEPFYVKKTLRNGEYWKSVLACLMANVAYYSTWALNIPDLSRFAKNIKSQLCGQLLGMPGSMLFIAFVGVYITSASNILFGEMIWNPNQIVVLLGSKLLTIIFAMGIFLATLTTNVTTNILPAINGVLNLLPLKLTYGKATVLVGVIAVIIQPWKLVSDPNGYIYNWLGLYGFLTGAVAGIFLVDYFIIKKQKIVLIDLYLDSESRYWYYKGFNFKAIISWVIAVIVPIAGCFCKTLQWAKNGGWIITFVIGALSYYVLTGKSKGKVWFSTVRNSLIKQREKGE